jgi:transcriptional regulator with XRE-family HTH domain
MVSRRALTDAVQKLRSHFGETQQQFAQRIGAAVITVARWETSRPPSGKSLEQLRDIARSENLTGCIVAFQEALDGNIEPTPAAAAAQVFQNDRERVLAMALVTALRDPEQYGDATKSVESTLRKPLSDVKASLDMERVDFRIGRAITGLHAKGESPERIAETLGVNEATVQQVLMLNRFGLIPELRVVTAPFSNAIRTRKQMQEPKRRVRREVMRVQVPAHPPQLGGSVQPKTVRRLRTVRKLSDVLEGYLNQEESEK